MISSLLFVALECSFHSCFTFRYVGILIRIFSSCLGVRVGFFPIHYPSSNRILSPSFPLVSSAIQGEIGLRELERLSCRLVLA